MKISSVISNKVLSEALFVAFVDRVTAIFAYKALILALFVVLGVLPANAARGGNSDGGGCVFTSPQKAPQLLDFVWTNIPLPSFSKGDQIPVTPKMKQEGVQTLNFTLLPSYQLALEKVGKWKAKNDIYANALYSALVSLNMLKIQATPYVFNDVDSSLCPLRPFLINGEAVRPVIIFTKELGLVLSVPTFNSLDLLSQAGLWIHESIRLMQILGNYLIAEDVMYGLTTTLLTKTPEAERLDSIYSLPAPLQEVRRQREALQQRVESLCGSDLEACNDLYAQQTLKENETLPGVRAMGLAVQELSRSPEERRKHIREQIKLLITEGRILTSDAEKTNPRK